MYEWTSTEAVLQNHCEFEDAKSSKEKNKVLTPAEHLVMFLGFLQV
jgi:hypothetical protein